MVAFSTRLCDSESWLLFKVIVVAQVVVAFRSCDMRKLQVVICALWFVMLTVVRSYC